MIDTYKCKLVRHSTGSGLTLSLTITEEDLKLHSENEILRKWDEFITKLYPNWEMAIIYLDDE